MLAARHVRPQTVFGTKLTTDFTIDHLWRRRLWHLDADGLVDFYSSLTYCSNFVLESNLSQRLEVFPAQQVLLELFDRRHGDIAEPAVEGFTFLFNVRKLSLFSFVEQSFVSWSKPLERGQGSGTGPVERLERFSELTSSEPATTPSY